MKLFTETSTVFLYLHILRFYFVGWKWTILSHMSCSFTYINIRFKFDLPELLYRKIRRYKELDKISLAFRAHRKSGILRHNQYDCDKLFTMSSEE